MNRNLNQHKVNDSFTTLLVNQTKQPKGKSTANEKIPNIFFSKKINTYEKKKSKYID